MFNLKKYSSNSNPSILVLELQCFNINFDNGSYSLRVYDEQITAKSAEECIQHISNGVKALKNEIYESWEDLVNLAYVITNSSSTNSGKLSNILFLHNVKQSIVLAQKFSQLQPVVDALMKMLYVDISSVSENVIDKFNKMYLKIKTMHKVIMIEMYRIELLKRLSKNTKLAQVAGPWSNLELPMSERVWEWDEFEDQNFEAKDKEIRNQPRYNPETNKMGYYYVWQEPANEPYTFDDFESGNMPYKTRNYLHIA